MFEIIQAVSLAPSVKRLEIRAPRVARKWAAGQFVIVRVHDRGERIPLTIASVDRDAGTITVIVQAIGKTTHLMNALEAGDALLDVVGPLGAASEIENFGTVVVVGGGVGTAIAYPTARALWEAGNRVHAIVGARNRELVILEEEICAVSHELHITTDDGSYGTKGFVTDQLAAIIASGERVDYVLAIGPIPMMRAVAEVTQPHGIRTVVSLNSIMVDGTGMCGGCRVLVGGKSEFACVDGPEFDAHDVDFEVLARRNQSYLGAERQSLEQYCAHPEIDAARVSEQCQLAARHPEVDDGKEALPR